MKRLFTLLFFLASWCALCAPIQFNPFTTNEHVNAGSGMVFVQTTSPSTLTISATGGGGGGGISNKFNGSIAVVGDSMAAATNAQSQQYCWPNFYMGLYPINLTGWFDNLAVNGENSVQFLSQVASATGEVPPGSPANKLMIIDGCPSWNDFGPGTNATTIEANITTLWNTIQADGWTFGIVIPWGSDGESSWTLYTSNQYTAVTTWVLAQTNWVFEVSATNIMKNLLTNGVNPGGQTVDGLHAYRIFDYAIAVAVKNAYLPPAIGALITNNVSQGTNTINANQAPVISSYALIGSATPYLVDGTWYVTAVNIIGGVNASDGYSTFRQPTYGNLLPTVTIAGGDGSYSAPDLLLGYETITNEVTVGTATPTGAGIVNINGAIIERQYYSSPFFGIGAFNGSVASPDFYGGFTKVTNSLQVGVLPPFVATNTYVSNVFGEDNVYGYLTVQQPTGISRPNAYTIGAFNGSLSSPDFSGGWALFTNTMQIGVANILSHGAALIYGYLNVTDGALFGGTITNTVWTPSEILVVDGNNAAVTTNTLTVGAISNVPIFFSNSASLFGFQINSNRITGTNATGRTFDISGITGDIHMAGLTCSTTNNITNNLGGGVTAGANITLTGGVNGTLTIAASGGGGGSSVWPSNPNQFITSASVTNLATNQTFSTVTVTAVGANTGFIGNGNGLTNLSYSNIVATPPVITQVATDASTAPTTTRIQLQGFQNGLYISCPDTPVLEPWFDIWYAVNGGTVYDIRAYRNTAWAIAAPQNASVAIGTIDGRSLRIVPIVVPTALVYPSGVTNWLAVDYSVPVIWEPPTPQIYLQSNGEAITLIGNTVTERQVWVKFFDLQGNVTSPETIFVPTNGNRTIWCPLSQVALACDDSMPIQIVAPPNTRFVPRLYNDVNNQIPRPSTFITCSTESQFELAISNVVAPQGIGLMDGAYPINISISNQCFASNIAAGFKGAEGVTIFSLSGNRDSCILYPNITAGGTVGTNNNNWYMDQTGAQFPFCIRDLTIIFTNANADMGFINGYEKLGNVRLTGTNFPNTNYQQLIAFSDSVGPNNDGSVNADMIQCQCDNSSHDCYATSGNYTNINCNVRLINCIGFTSGPNAADQDITAHFGLNFNVYGGNYYDSLAIVAPDFPTNTINCFYVKFNTGNREVNGPTGCNLFACTVNGSQASSGIPTGGYAEFCRFFYTNITSDLFRNVSGYVSHNIATATLTTGSHFIFNSATPVVADGNIVLNFAEGIRLQNSSGLVGTNQYIFGNDFLTGGSTAAISGGDNNIPLVLTNNVSSNTTYAVLIGTTQLVGNNYNVWDGKITSPTYVEGAGDVTNVNGALTAPGLWFPVASGNADGTGSATTTNIGDLDPYGLVRVYKAGVTSKGARANPAFLSSAQLLPIHY